MTTIEPFVVHPGESVDLVVDVDGGIDGEPLLFVIEAAGGDVVTALDATVDGGKARRRWTVEVGTRPVPLDLLFRAGRKGPAPKGGGPPVIVGAPVDSEHLRVEPAVALGTPGLDPSSSSPTTGGGLAFAGGLRAIGVGEELRFRFEVVASRPVQLAYTLIVVTADADGKEVRHPPAADTPPEVPSETLAAAAGPRVLQRAWTARFVEPRPAQPIQGARFVISLLDPSTGEALAPAKETPIFAIFDRIEVRAVDPDAMAVHVPPRRLLPQAPFAGEKDATNPAWESHLGWQRHAVRLLGRTSQHAGAAQPLRPDDGGMRLLVPVNLAEPLACSIESLSFMATTKTGEVPGPIMPGEPVRWHLIPKGAEKPGTVVDIQLNETNVVAVQTRLRLSMWVDEGFFSVPQEAIVRGKKTLVASQKFSDAHIANAACKPGIVDDLSLLHTIKFARTASGEPTIVLAQNSARYYRDAIAACHGKSIQLLAGFGQMLKEPSVVTSAEGQVVMENGKPKRAPMGRGTLPDQPSTHPLLQFLHEADPQFDGVAIEEVDELMASATPEQQAKGNQVAKFVSNIMGFFADQELDFDGISMDIEGATPWSERQKRNLRRLYRLLGYALALRGKLLTYANGGNISDTNLDVVVPVKGAAAAQPFQLARDAPNVICRPMAYDTRHLGDALRNWHHHIVDYALRPPGYGKGEGAGLHGSQFQLGVKIFNGKNGNLGFLQAYPGELGPTCREVLRTHRVGLVLFALSVSKDATFSWQNLATVNRFLNPVALDGSGEETLPVRLGQPLQAPLNPSAVQRLGLAPGA